MDAGGGMLEINVRAAGAAHLQLAPLTVKRYRSEAIRKHCLPRTGPRPMTSTLRPLTATSPNYWFGRVG